MQQLKINNNNNNNSTCHKENVVDDVTVAYISYIFRFIYKNKN